MSPVDAAKWRVAVVEDDEDLQYVFRALLESAGCEVTCFGAARDALDRLRAEPPDAICLDLRMPGMDGYGFLAAKREEPALAAVPVVVTTAEADVRTPQGMPVLRKPFDPDALVKTVRRLVRRNGARRSP